ncbi:MAG: biotin/lipoyl-containing protein, partial [Pseudomonadota bacterium]
MNHTDAEADMKAPENATNDVVHEVRMPSLTPDETEGQITKWHVKEGQTINPGDVIADIMTERATMEVEAEDAGQIISILHQAGPAKITIGSPIAVISAKSDNHDLAAPSGISPNQEKSPDQEAPTDHLAERSPPTVQRAVNPSAHETDTPLKSLTLRVALREALQEEMERDDSVFLLGEDVADDEGTYKVTYGLHAKFGDRRVRNIPVAPAGVTGLAIGAAMAGLRPVLEYQH